LTEPSFSSDPLVREMKRFLLILSAAIVLAMPGYSYADLQDGLDAIVKGDFKTALKELKPLAEQRNASAAVRLGWMYAEGNGVAQDHKEAVKWYRLAAEQGDAEAQYNLGVMYQDGKGVNQYYREAVKWYRLSADQGYAVAQNNLGTMYYHGKGVAQDQKEAEKWFKLAAQQGNAEAQNKLDAMYDGEGKGDIQDNDPVTSIKFKKGSEGSGLAILEKDLDNIFLRIKDGERFNLLGIFYGRYEGFGTVDLSGDGYEDILLVFGDYGSGYTTTYLGLFSTSKNEFLFLSLGKDHSPADIITGMGYSDNYWAPHLKKEREYLENEKYDHGYLDAQMILKDIKNPEYAAYFWVEDNGRINNGKLKIRKYKEQLLRSNCGDRILRDGAITYRACFKSGVEAYDENTGEYYIVFFPSWYYYSPTILRKVGDYLIIGTYGDGIAILNTETSQIKRLYWVEQGFGGNNIVSSMEIKNSRIVVNDSVAITLSGKIIRPNPLSSETGAQGDGEGQAGKTIYHKDGHFTIQLPNDWIEIPKEILDEKLKIMKGMVKNIDEAYFDYGYQLDRNKGWVSYPYVFIQNTDGRYSEKSLHTLTDLKQDDWEKEMEEDFSKILSDIELGAFIYSAKENIIWSFSELSLNEGLVITEIGAIHPTEYGSINIYCSIIKAEKDLFAKTCRSIIKSVVLDEEIKYRPNPKFKKYLPFLFKSKKRR